MEIDNTPEERRFNKRMYFVMFALTVISIALLITYLTLNSIQVSQNSQRIYEDSARDKQAGKIIKNLSKEFETYTDNAFKRGEKAERDRGIILNETLNISRNLTTDIKQLKNDVQEILDSINNTNN